MFQTTRLITQEQVKSLLDIPSAISLPFPSVLPVSILAAPSRFTRKQWRKGSVRLSLSSNSIESGIAYLFLRSILKRNIISSFFVQYEQPR